MVLFSAELPAGNVVGGLVEKRCAAYGDDATRSDVRSALTIGHGVPPLTLFPIAPRNGEKERV
jgi:hypothetical protein